MVMHVMFVDMHFMDKGRDHDCNMVHEIVRVDVPLASCPPHVAPGATAAAVDVYCSTSGNDCLHLWLVEGPDLKLRFAVVWVTAASDEVE